MAEWDWRLPPPQVAGPTSTPQALPNGSQLTEPRVVPAPPPPPPSVTERPEGVRPTRGRGRGWSIAAALAVVVGVGSLALRAVDGDSKGSSTSATSVVPLTTASTSSAAPAPTTAAVATTPAVVTTARATTTAATAAATTAVATTVPPTTVAAATAPTSGPPIRWAVYQGGKVYLRGVVPSDAVAKDLATRAGKALGPNNVIDEYSRVPGAAVPPSAPLYVADLVLFESDSARLRPEFVPLLELGVKLMTLFPKVTITVRGHTDSLGTREHNAQLAEARVQAVIDYVAGRGIDASRLVGEAVASAEPTADNDTPAGRQLNRRAEFVITGLLDS